MLGRTLFASIRNLERDEHGDSSFELWAAHEAFMTLKLVV